MTDTPNLPPLLTTITHKLGGSGKSLGGQLIVDAAYRSGLDLHVFENDGQRFYDAYGNVNHVTLPPTEEVVHDQIADIRVHSEFDRILRESGSNDCLVYDCAAASINRHTYIIDQLDIGLRLDAMGRTALVLVPTSARDDIAREALEAWEIWRDLLPSPHRVIPMISHRDGSVKSLPAGHDLRKLVKIAGDGVFDLPRVPSSVIDGIRKSGMTLGELGDNRNPLATAEMARKMGMDPTIVQLMRRVASGLIEDTNEQMLRLGFTLGL